MIFQGDIQMLSDILPDLLMLLFWIRYMQNGVMIKIWLKA